MADCTGLGFYLPNQSSLNSYPSCGTLVYRQSGGSQSGNGSRPNSSSVFGTLLCLICCPGAGDLPESNQFCTRVQFHCKRYSLGYFPEPPRPWHVLLWPDSSRFHCFARDQWYPGSGRYVFYRLFKFGFFPLAFSSDSSNHV